MNDNDFPQQVAEQRVQIAALKLEQEAVFSQKRSRAEVAEAVNQQIAHLETKGREAMERSLQMFAAGVAASPTLLHGMAGADGVARLDIGPLLAAAVGTDRMREMYLAGLDSVPVGLPREERKKRLEEISYALETAEQIEEWLIEQSETAGNPIARRPDARASIILAAKAA
ncbi:MAG: hypothetical protein Q8M77_13875 [Hydrogenophaga sp.]|uniref:hypothetical protein n=1 Tax=Hydrogenophaga sp. TaxID=1904254 RepID=UPI002732218E|nr:hypothetical protein [Hydrogenophaga sp.]MDP2015500.1 hypothetical protein [Hydrogenophaga sp.]MDP3252987.1 hypothetical protein [Hydrogenophaga sp.]